MQFARLNPGVGMELKQGTTLCVRGMYDIAAGACTNVMCLHKTTCMHTLC